MKTENEEITINEPNTNNNVTENDEIQDYNLEETHTDRIFNYVNMRNQHVADSSIDKDEL